MDAKPGCCCVLYLRTHKNIITSSGFVCVLSWIITLSVHTPAFPPRLSPLQSPQEITCCNDYIMEEGETHKVVYRESKTPVAVTDK